MSAEIIAKRYARALFNQAKNSKLDLDDAVSTLGSVCSLFDMPDAAKVLKSPVMSKKLKKEILVHAAEKGAASEMISIFIRVIVDSKRTPILPQILISLRDIVDIEKNQARALLVTACQVEAHFEESLKSLVEKKLGKNILLTKEVDPDLLGGFVLKVGHKVLDLSLKTKVKALTAKVTA